MVYGAIGGVIAAIDPIIAGLMLTMGVAEAIHSLFSTYTEPGDQICAGAAGVVGAVTAITTSWMATSAWDNWSNGRGRPGLGGEGPDGRPSNSGSEPELGGGPSDDGSGGPYDPPSGGTPGDEAGPEWPTGGGLDDSDQQPTSGSLDDSDQHPTGAGDDGPGTSGLGNHYCSFSEATPVATEDGETPIGDLELGDKVLAYNEETGELEYQEVTAVWEHYDNVLLLTIDGETLETTTDHPFYTDEAEWIAAGDLEIGVRVRKSDGTFGEVETIVQTEITQPMFNLTVDEVHTYFVGDEQWLVHNWCGELVRDKVINAPHALTQADINTIAEAIEQYPSSGKRVIAILEVNGKWYLGFNNALDSAVPSANGPITSRLPTYSQATGRRVLAANWAHAETNVIAEYIAQSGNVIPNVGTMYVSHAPCGGCIFESPPAELADFSPGNINQTAWSAGFNTLQVNAPGFSETIIPFDPANPPSN